MFIVTKVKEITEASASVGLLLATAVTTETKTTFDTQLTLSE